MKNYNEALKSIQKVKELVKGLTFREAELKLAGYNGDNELFDYDFGNITGTIWNNNGMAQIKENAEYDVIDDDFRNAEEPIESHLTESEIVRRVSEYSVIIGRNEIMNMSYDEMNYYECIDDGD